MRKEGVIKRGWSIGIIAFLLILPIAISTSGGSVAREQPPIFSLEKLFAKPLIYGRQPSGARWSPDGRMVAFYWNEKGGDVLDIYIVPATGGKPVNLTNWEEEEPSPGARFFGGGQFQWSPDSLKLLYVYKGDLFIINPSGGAPRQLTNTKGGEASPQWSPDGKEILFVKDGNIFIMGVDEGLITQLTSNANDEVQNRNPRYSPDRKKVAFTTYNNEKVRTVVVPNYVGKYVVANSMKRSVAGDSIPTPALGIVPAEGGKVVWVDFGPEQEFYISGSWWSPDGSQILINKVSKDQKVREILVASASDGKTRLLDGERDEKWIDSLSSFLSWSPDGKRILFTSERDGWSHIYLLSLEGGSPKQLTRGEFEVTNPKWSRDGSRIYFTSSQTSPFERHLYFISSEGGRPTRLTKMPGVNWGVVSPDEKHILITRSYSTHPPELYLMENSTQATPVQVTRSPSEEFYSYDWIDYKIISFPSRADGKTIYARLYEPPRLNPRRKYPLVVFIHGAGYMQNVLKGWTYYTHEYLFNNLLVNKGYVVLDTDYRGSAGYGRDFRTDVYRHLGGLDLEDLISGVEYMVKQGYIDPERVGCYGGSYGGFLTLMALFNSPDTFRCGAALRPVTDWENYHTHYTTQRLNTPQSDLEAFRQSSPIHFAKNLKAHLLICHGVLDSNVHFQDTVQLVQKLIEYGKSFELMIYPKERHSFRQPKSWIDEYRRIEQMFDNYLRK